ncbi:MAG: lipoprotein LpqH [Actinomycetaceae bacterium]
MHLVPSRRRVTASAAVLALATVLAACGGGDDGSTSDDDATTEEATTGSGPESPSERPEIPTSGAIPPNDTENLPEGVENITNTSAENRITVGTATAEGEVSVECLGNDQGMVVSLAGTSPDHGDLSAVLSFQEQALTSVVVQSTESPDGGGPTMWMTSSGPGEELTVEAVEDGGIWTVTGPIGGFDGLTQTPIEGAEVDIVADCSFSFESPSDGSGSEAPSE